MVITAESTKAWVIRLAEVFAREKERLTELDSSIGDADHGINLDRGFSAVREELNKVNPDGIADILKTTAMVLIRTVGGASGPLYGTWFLKAATTVGGATTLDGAAFVAMVEEATNGLKARGKSDVGEKTMVDVWVPVLARLKSDLAEGKELDAMLDAAVSVAEAQVAATIPMIAKKGRASFLGERSIGHQDPGATSSWLMIRAACETLPVRG